MTWKRHSIGPSWLSAVLDKAANETMTMYTHPYNNIPNTDIVTTINHQQMLYIKSFLTLSKTFYDKASFTGEIYNCVISSEHAI